MKIQLGTAVTSMLTLPGCQHPVCAKAACAEDESEFTCSHSPTGWLWLDPVRGNLSEKTQQSWEKQGGGCSLPCLLRHSAEGHQCCMWNIGTSEPTQSQAAWPQWDVSHISMTQSIGAPSDCLNLYLFPFPNPFVLCKATTQSQQFDAFPVK